MVKTRGELRSTNLALCRARRALAGVRGRVLEVGCGQGRFLRAFCSVKPFRQGHGCDIDRRALVVGRALGDGYAYLQAGASHLPYADASFDIVLIFDVLEHLKDSQAGLDEVARVLRPGGFLHVLVPCEGQPSTLYRFDSVAALKKRHGGHLQRFTHKEVLVQLGRAGFEVEKASYSMHPLGQVKDVFTYLAQEDRAKKWRLSPLLQGLVWGLWPLAYLESELLSRVGFSAVNLHISARRLPR